MERDINPQKARTLKRNRPRMESSRARLGFWLHREGRGSTKRGPHESFYMWAYGLRDKRAFGLRTVGFSHLSKWAKAHFSSKVGIGLVARLIELAA